MIVLEDLAIENVRTASSTGQIRRRHTKIASLIQRPYKRQLGNLRLKSVIVSKQIRIFKRQLLQSRAHYLVILHPGIFGGAPWYFWGSIGKPVGQDICS